MGEIYFKILFHIYIYTHAHQNHFFSQFISLLFTTTYKWILLDISSILICYGDLNHEVEISAELEKLFWESEKNLFLIL